MSQIRIEQIARECVAVRLRMLNRVVTNVYDEALRPLGLKVSQMNILVAVALMGSSRPTDLGEALHIDISTLSRNLERMKNRGWLELLSDDHDGRAQQVRLTSEGRELLKTAAGFWEAAQSQVIATLGAEMVQQLTTSTDRIRTKS